MALSGSDLLPKVVNFASKEDAKPNIPTPEEIIDMKCDPEESHELDNIPATVYEVWAALLGVYL